MTSEARDIQDLVQSAARLEQSDPRQAAEVWNQVAASFPQQSSQHQFALARASALARGERMPPLVPSAFNPRAIALTIGSMIVSIVVYAQVMHSWSVSAGFVLLILVHEMGHVVANVRYGIRASLPLFIPFVGAVINLRQQPPNAKVEAIIGIAGPVAGTIGALACFAWYWKTGAELALLLSWFGFMINLFNLLPVPPLDGGRVAAAISPWIWVVGLIGLGVLVVDDFRHGHNMTILLILLIIALPRVVRTLKAGGRTGPYYQISRQSSFAIGAVYLVLLGILAVGRWYVQSHLQLQFG